MKKFVIFGTGRSGSTLLVSLLNAHECIHCDGEIFHRKRWQRWRRSIWFILRRYPAPYIYYRLLKMQIHRHTSVYGFKLLFQQLDFPSKQLTRLHASGWHILYLCRHSIFDQTISIQVAQITRRFHGNERNGTEPNLDPFPINPEQFLQIFLERQQYARLCREAVVALPHLEIVYEADLQNAEWWSTTIARICNYLDIEAPSNQVQTSLTKPWSRPYSEFVTNYAELAELARRLETDA